MDERPADGAQHDGEIENPGRARCACGWRGELLEFGDACQDAADHSNECSEPTRAYKVFN